jgi:hypothetical protein
MVFPKDAKDAKDAVTLLMLKRTSGHTMKQAATAARR